MASWSTIFPNTKLVLVLVNRHPDCWPKASWIGRSWFKHVQTFSQTAAMFSGFSPCLLMMSYMKKHFLLFDFHNNSVKQRYWHPYFKDEETESEINLPKIAHLVRDGGPRRIRRQVPRALPWAPRHEDPAPRPRRECPVCTLVPGDLGEPFVDTPRAPLFSDTHRWDPRFSRKRVSFALRCTDLELRAFLAMPRPALTCLLRI